MIMNNAPKKRGRPKGSKNKKKGGEKKKVKEEVVSEVIAIGSKPKVEVSATGKKRGRPSKAELDARVKLAQEEENKTKDAINAKALSGLEEAISKAVPAPKPKETKSDKFASDNEDDMGDVFVADKVLARKATVSIPVPEPISKLKYYKGDKIKRISNDEPGTIEFHRPDSNCPYINWGGGFYCYMHVDAIKLVKAASVKK
jgi:hypothetical protein